MPPSFSGLGHRPLTAAAPVRIRLGVRGSGCRLRYSDCHMPPSFSGLGHRPLTAAAPVRIRLGVRGTGARSTARWNGRLVYSPICSPHAAAVNRAHAGEGSSVVHQAEASRSLPVVTVSPRSSSERRPPSRAENRPSEGCVRPSWHSTTDPAPASSLTASAAAAVGV